jgi:hypothetical protein
MWWDTSKDYMNALLGAAFLFITIITIPEIRKNRKYWIPILIGIVVLGALGIDKINRDSKKDEKNEQRSNTDSANISQLKTNLKELKDTIGQFKHRLDSDFHIIDSANIPILQQNYNTKINKARDVYIGPH